MTLPSPPGPPPPRPNKPSTEPPRGRLPGRIWLAIFLALLAWNVVLFFAPSTDNSVKVPYSAFLVEAQRNNIATVTFKGQELDGTFRQAIPSPSPSGALPASPAPAGSPAAAQPPPTYGAFTTVVPPLGDPALLPLLESHGVTIPGLAIDYDSIIDPL